MKLFTMKIRQALIKNGKTKGTLYNTFNEQGIDFFPVVKFFNPQGAATWLFTQIIPSEQDLLFGLCDLGIGSPKLAYISPSRLESLKSYWGLKMVRDRNFKATHLLSVYAEAARWNRRITEQADALNAAAEVLKAKIE